MTAKQQHSIRRASQRGAVLLLFMTVIAVGATFMLLRSLNSANIFLQRDQQAYEVLRQAKEALINWTITQNGTALGSLPFPDILDTQPSGDEMTPPNTLNFDGKEDRHCFDTTSFVTLNLGVASRCFGRLPWQTLNLFISNVTQINPALPPTDQIDPTGEMPWYAVSANLLDPCFVNRINPDALNFTYPVSAPTYHCGLPTQLPHPWLTVVDHRGNVLSNRVAFVLIMPGLKMNTQNRYVLGLPRNYLDAVTVTSDCTAPCVPGTPGTYDNGGFNPGNIFIAGLDTAKVAGNDSAYGQPYVFNDKLIYVTIDEFMDILQKRALQEVKQRLLNFYATNRHFPFAATLGTSSCHAPLTEGHLATAQGTCAAGEFVSGLPTWFTNANWQRYIYYALAQNCQFGTTDCNGTSGWLTVGNNANVRVLLIGTGRPVKSLAGQTPSMTTPPYAASTGSPGRDQTGCCTSALAADYLDSVENANGDTVYDAIGLARSTLYNDQIMIVAP